MSWAERRAAKEAATQEAQWQIEHGILADGVVALDRIATGVTVDDPRLMLKKGELALHSGSAALVEVRSTGGQYQGGSRGVSVRVAKGVTYRVGASRGTYQPNPATEQVVDHGQWYVTNQRIVFMGLGHTREWAFAKLIGRTSSATGVVMLQVSNRQKPSGLVAGAATDFWVALASAIYQGGLAEARAMLEQTIDDHNAQRPTAVVEQQQSAIASVAPGWYSDPWGIASQRWYDGGQWTSHTS